MTYACISLEDLSFGYTKDQLLFKDVTLELASGGFYFLTGASGSGKSSLLQLMYLALRPTHGTLRILGKPTHTLAESRRRMLRQKMGIVFQDFRLLDHMTILENVSLPLRIRGCDGKTSNTQARELLSWVGVPHFERFPAQLSGGEKQRVAIARAIIAKPDILFADEPTGNIDDETALKVFYLFEELHKLGTTVVVATHNQQLLHHFAHPTLVCHNQSVTTSDQYAQSQETSIPQAS